MKITVEIETEDITQLKRLSKVDDMVAFIFELVNNGWREFEDTGYDYHSSWCKINELLDRHNIDIEDLI